jgi:hypothetical protein
LPRCHYQLIVLMLVAAGLATGSGLAQTAPANDAVTRVRSVRVIPSADGPAIEIITTCPIAPSILTLKNPSRLVIDLPNSLLSSHKAIDFRSDQVDGIRANQFQNAPPITRVVVDLAKPVGYSWDAAGNRLMIRLKALEQKIAPAPTTAQGSAPDLVPVGPGAIVQTVSRSEGQGSSLTAGNDAAIMHLPRGGQVRVCPGTSVSVNYSKNGHDMLLAMNTGALEAHYMLDTSADSVMTPDFRILFAGPGEFDFAISADSRGNTCVRSLHGNTGAAIVSELMGSGTYQVTPTEQVVFRGGQISQRVAGAPADCGCPESPVPALIASTGTRPADAPLPQAVASSAAISPEPDHNQVHIQVDAPLVFRANDPVIPPATVLEVARLSLVYSQRPTPLEVVVLPPAPEVIAAKPRNSGFLGKIKGFFSAIFR